VKRSEGGAAKRDCEIAEALRDGPLGSADEVAADRARMLLRRFGEQLAEIENEMLGEDNKISP
jgi:hypothetical protein